MLQGVNLSLARGSSLALTGESGCGKTTLLHLVAGLDPTDSGQILIDGTSLDCRSESSLAQWRRQGIDLVFQKYGLISSLDVATNLAFQARLAGRHDPQWVAYLAERLGLTGLLARYPEQLSGGQQQRVAIGRALAGHPAWLLADEPTGSLDEVSSDELLNLLLQLFAEAAWINDWALQGSGGIESLRMSAGGEAFRYDLRLHSDRPLVLHGDQGYSEKYGKGQASYYYSQPFCRMDGEVERHSLCIAVTITRPPSVTFHT